MEPRPNSGAPRSALKRLTVPLALLIAALATAAPLAARSLAIQNFSDEVIVLPSGTLDVTETIEARFTGSWNGIYRTIPVEYRTPQGFNYTLFLQPISATDDAGQPLRYETRRERHYLKFKIYVPGAVNTTRTIKLHYRVLDGLKFFQDHDELYWNVTGDEWDVPIQSANAEIILPAGVTGVRTLGFTGSYGSRSQDADIETQNNLVEVRTRRSLAFHEGLTIVVGWDKGFVHEPGALEKISLWLRSNWPIFFPIAIFFVMFWLWYTRGRDPRLRPISVQYEPPAQLSPGEVGTLVDNSADMRDITATIVDLAVRGYLVIEETSKDHLMGLISNKEYTFHLKKKPAEWASLKSHERELLAGIFDDGSSETVQLSELQNRFYKNLPGIRDSIFGALLKRGYYLRRPDKVRKAYLVGGIVVGFLAFWGSGFFSALLGMAPLSFIVAGVLTAAIIAGFGWFMPARTIQGTRALESTLGFEDFLGHVEADRMERTIRSPETFEKFLPFAMALGVEKKWVKAFQDIYTQPPSWYRGAYGPNFYALGFVNDLNHMTARASSVMASAPRSSGGSGFGGGGFSGGGFGGGGGGGF